MREGITAGKVNRTRNAVQPLLERIGGFGLRRAPHVEAGSYHRPLPCSTSRSGRTLSAGLLGILCQGYLGCYTCYSETQVCTDGTSRPDCFTLHARWVSLSSTRPGSSQPMSSHRLRHNPNHSFRHCLSRSLNRLARARRHRNPNKLALSTKLRSLTVKATNCWKRFARRSKKATSRKRKPSWPIFLPRLPQA